jgi:alcohol dehydrogenase
MIITDKGVRANKLLEPIETAFASTDAEIGYIFDDVPPDSSLETVRNAAQFYRDNNCDAIIAVGGGSVIDTSKATNILVSEGGNDLLKYSGAHNLQTHSTIFVIPTTSGTGSEVTMVAVVSDTQKNVKLAFASYYLMPHAAILDPRMTQTLPAHLTAMTAMDAMTHAIEAYTCSAANPLLMRYVQGALKKSVKTCLMSGKPIRCTSMFRTGTSFNHGGIAFSNSMVGLVHSLGMH